MRANLPISRRLIRQRLGPWSVMNQKTQEAGLDTPTSCQMHNHHKFEEPDPLDGRGTGDGGG